ncbi:hypothetical protein B4U80_13232, partial [Leptotrombidium deliense]
LFGEMQSHTDVCYPCHDYPDLEIDAIASGYSPNTAVVVFNDSVSWIEWDSVESLNFYPTVNSCTSKAEIFEPKINALMLFNNETYRVIGKDIRVKYKPSKEAYRYPQFKELPRRAVIQATFVHKVSREYYFIAFYKEGNDRDVYIGTEDEKQYTKEEFNIRKTDTNIVAIDYFAEGSQILNRTGIKAVGNVSYLFSTHRNSKSINLSPIGPALDSQVLFGCPISHCFLSEIDAIDYNERADMRLLIVWQHFVWFLKDLKDMPSRKNQENYDNLFNDLIEPRGKRKHVQALFFHNRSTFYVQNNALFKVKEKKALFSLPDTVTAICSHMNTNSFYLFKGHAYNAEYCILSIENVQFKIENCRPIGDLVGFPNDIDGAFRIGSVIFVISKNFIYWRDEHESSAVCFIHLIH